MRRTSEEEEREEREGGGKEEENKGGERKREREGGRERNRDKEEEQEESSSDSAATIEEWLGRVRSVQNSRMTPEVAQRLEMQRKRHQNSAKRSKTLSLSVRSARIQRCSQMSRTLWAGSMTAAFIPQASRPLGAAESVERVMDVDQESMSRTMQGMDQIQSLMASPAVVSQEDDDAFDAAAESLMLAASPALAAAGAGAGAGAVADIEVGEDEIHKLLQQLHKEPSNDEERAAKFQLYEKYSETVSDARRATLDFWVEAAPEFEGTAKAAVQNDIRKLDGENNLGFDFMQADSRWFVYDMANQAHFNSGKIERLLASMRTKLELLSSQSECPICLEAFEEESGDGDGAEASARPTTTLSCCHKVCTGCWEQWKRMNPHNAFCPLCRQQEFLMRILPA